MHGGWLSHIDFDDNEEEMAAIQRRMMDIVWAYNSQDDLWLWHTHTHTWFTEHTHTPTQSLPLNVGSQSFKDVCNQT